MKKARFICSLLTAILLLVSLAACTQSPEQEPQTEQQPSADQPQSTPEDNSVDQAESIEDTVVLKFGAWGDASTFEVFEYMVSGIQDAVPEVSHIELMQYASTGEFWTQLPSQIAAGTAPDVAFLTNELVFEMISNGLIIPVDESIIDPRTSEDAIRAWVVDGTLYSVPVNLQPTLIAINLNVWEQAGLTEEDFPETWADVENVSSIIKERVEGVYPMCINIEEMFHVTQIVQGFGGGWDFGRSIDNPQNKQAIQWIIDMFDQEYAVTPVQAGANWDGEMVAMGTAAMSTGGVWYYYVMMEHDMGDHFTAIPIPRLDNNNRGSSLHSDAVVILSHTAYPELAKQAAVYIAREEAQLARAEGTGNVPVFTDLVDFYYEARPQFMPIKGSEAYAIPFAYPSAAGRFLTNFVNVLSGAIYDSANSMTGDELIQEVIDMGDYN